jgi:HD-like signal output (HDOD) protein/ActR/RegA family two-component response regulator
VDATNGKEATPRSTHEPCTVLVIDDEERVREALRRSLVALGHRVAIAVDGCDGLRQLAAVRPTVVIVDLRMPTMDGHTFLRNVAGRNLDTSVIVTSGHGDMDDVIQVFRLGAVDYLRKPWTQTELAAAIARVSMLARGRRASPPSLRAPGSMAGPPVSQRAPSSTKLLAAISKDEVEIPSVPSVLAELRALVANPEAPIERVSNLVERDQALVSRLLRLGRSAHYSGMAKTTHLRTLIGRIGFRQVHMLVEAIWLNSCFQIRDPRYLGYSARLARHALARAVAMRALASHCRLDGSAAYLAGLFADVGATFLLSKLAESPPQDRPDPENALAIIREQHEEAGARVLAHWGHDELLVRVAGQHHVLSSSSPPYASLAVIASGVANELTGDEDLTSRDGRPTGDILARSSAAIGIEELHVQRLIERLRGEYATALEFLG